MFKSDFDCWAAHLSDNQKKALNRIKMNEKNIRTKASFKKTIAYSLKPINFAATISD